MSAQPLRRESEPRVGSSRAVPISGVESELASRIGEAIGPEGISSFGRRCGLSESLLRKYLTGSEPSASKTVAIADAANVSLEWLAAGRGSKQRQLQDGVRLDDLDRLTRTVAAVEEGLRQAKLTLPPPKYAELVSAAYQLMGAPSTSSAHIIQFIKAAHR